MSLLTYKDARPWAKAIRGAIISGKMPPWSPDKQYGRFANDLSLTAAEKDTLLSWIDSGAHEGKIKEAPERLSFPDGWRIPNPDVTFELPEPYAVPASGVIDYQYIRVPTNFTEDKWVEMVEVRPSERSVVHHAIVLVNTPGARQEYLGGYAPGMTPQVWKPGQARRIRAGATLEFQLHYQANGKAANDRTKIGLVFAKQPVTEQVIGTQVMPYGLDIPPGDPNFRVDASGMFGVPVKLVGMRAHMHLRGKSMDFRAVYPTGENETLLSVPQYDFNWQPYYYLETPKLLPRGTRLEITAFFDNSANNKFNPDPTAAVHWGPQTWDEMCIGWVDIAVDRKIADQVPRPSAAIE